MSKGHARITQFDYRDAEKVGLIKFDLLGLRTLDLAGSKDEGLFRQDG